MSSGEYEQEFTFEDEDGIEFDMNCVVEWEVEYYSPAEPRTWEDEGCEEEIHFKHTVYEAGNEDEELDDLLVDQIEEALYDHTLNKLKK